MSKFARKQLPAPLSLAFAAVTPLVYLPVTRQEFVNHDDGGHATGNFTVKASLIQQRLQLYQDHQPFRQSFLFTNAAAKEPPQN